MILIVRAYRAAEARTWREFTGEEILTWHSHPTAAPLETLS